MTKDLKYYQSLNYKMIFEYDKHDSVWFVQFPELPGCVAHGKTIRKALNMGLKVKNEWLKWSYEDGWKINEPEEGK